MTIKMVDSMGLWHNIRRLFNAAEKDGKDFPVTLYLGSRTEPLSGRVVSIAQDHLHMIEFALGQNFHHIIPLSGVSDLRITEEVVS